MDNADFLSRLGSLPAAVVADALDSLGHRRQTLGPGLTGLGRPDRLVGRAATLTVIAVDEVPEKPYTVQFAAIDALQPGDVMVIAAPPGVDSAFWGELITTRAMVKGCRGAIVDGYSRDLAQIRTRDFGLWARGTHPADSAGRLDAVDFGGEVTVAGVRVAPADFVLADVDGIVVVPADLIVAVLDAAEVKFAVEDTVRAELRSGATIVETYARYGVM